MWLVHSTFCFKVIRNNFYSYIIKKQALNQIQMILGKFILLNVCDMISSFLQMIKKLTKEVDLCVQRFSERDRESQRERERHEDTCTHRERERKSEAERGRKTDRSFLLKM